MDSRSRTTTQRARRTTGSNPSRNSQRRGKILVAFVVVLPALIGVVGLVVDSGLLTLEQRRLQHVADAAAGAAARDLQLGKSLNEMTTTANRYVRQYNELPDANVRVRTPPSHGNFAGDGRYVEVELTQRVKTYVLHLLGGEHAYTLRGRAVAGVESSTAGVAMMILEPRPTNRSAGLDFLAFRDVQATGAIVVNTEWGALDQDGEPAGRAAGPYYAIRSGGGQIRAPDIRVSGGVDQPPYYQGARLRANCLPAEDPFARLAEPSIRRGRRTEEFGGVRISASWRGGRQDEGQPLQPGTYDWIDMTSGEAVFDPGLYVIQSVNPQTGLALRLAGGSVSAQGVLFYITDANSGGGPAIVGGSAHSTGVYINVGSNSQFSPLRDPRSPYDGLLIFQQRDDRRTLVIDQWGWASRNGLSGCVYARDGHVLLRFTGTCEASFVCGTMQVLAWQGGTIAPLALLPPVKDVFLVE